MTAPDAEDGAAGAAVGLGWPAAPTPADDADVSRETDRGTPASTGLGWAATHRVSPPPVGGEDVG